MPSRTSVRAKAARIAGACIAVRLRLLTRRITSIYNRELRPHGLTIQQMNVLVVVFRLQEATQQEVSRALHLEKSTVSRDVGRMCDRGWLIRTRNDRRAARLVVTPAGQRLLHTTFPAWVAAQKESSALLGSAAVASLRRLADLRRGAAR
jgi:DNA-binding MarR family transcriptional regulator